MCTSRSSSVELTIYTIFSCPFPP